MSKINARLITVCAFTLQEPGCSNSPDSLFQAVRLQPLPGLINCLKPVGKRPNRTRAVTDKAGDALWCLCRHRLDDHATHGVAEEMKPVDTVFLQFIKHLTRKTFNGVGSNQVSARAKTGQVGCQQFEAVLEEFKLLAPDTGTGQVSMHENQRKPRCLCVQR